MARTYPTASCSRHFIITPGAGVITPRPESTYVNTDGLLVADDENDVEVRYNVKAGTALPFIPKRVKAETTAQIIAWW